MVATRLRHRDVEAQFNKLSRDLRRRPWKRGLPDAESSAPNVNSTTDPHAAAGSAPPTEEQSADRESGPNPPRDGKQNAATKPNSQPLGSTGAKESPPQKPNLSRFQKPKSDANPNGTRNGAGYWVPMD